MHNLYPPRVPPLKERIIAVIVNNPHKVYKTEDILMNARFSGRNKNTVRGTLSELSRRGLLIRIAKGVYKVNLDKVEEFKCEIGMV